MSARSVFGSPDVPGQCLDEANQILAVLAEAIFDPDSEETEFQCGAILLFSQVRALLQREAEHIERMQRGAA